MAIITIFEADQCERLNDIATGYNLYGRNDYEDGDVTWINLSTCLSESEARGQMASHSCYRELLVVHGTMTPAMGEAVLCQEKQEADANNQEHRKGG